MTELTFKAASDEELVRYLMRDTCTCDQRRQILRELDMRSRRAQMSPFDQGQESRLDDYGVARNPFPPGSKAAERWEAGYDRAEHLCCEGTTIWINGVRAGDRRPDWEISCVH